LQLTGVIVAIKVVDNSKLTSEKLVSNLEKEIEILMEIKHPNIVNLFDTIVCIFLAKSMLSTPS